jgi:hypothetical protein
MSKKSIYQPFSSAQLQELEKINSMVPGAAKNTAIDAIAKACNKQRSLITTKLWYMAKNNKKSAITAMRTIEFPIKEVSIRDNKVIITY